MNTQDLGGIDMNSRNLHLKTQGDSFEFQDQPDFAQIQEHNVAGLYPVITRIRPVHNLSVLLGITGI